MGTRRILTVAALGAATVVSGLAGAACGTDTRSGGPGDTFRTLPPATTELPAPGVTFPTATEPADTVSFRPVATASGDLSARPGLDQLGPVAVDGNGLLGAVAERNPQTTLWMVRPLFSPAGIAAFNQAAAACAAKAASCPTGQIAVVIDGEVVIAPVIQTPAFAADQVQISGAFDEPKAREIAREVAAAAHGS